MGKNILITGATGNIGRQLIDGLYNLNTKHNIIAADIQPDQAQRVFSDYSKLKVRELDFSRYNSFSNALDGIDIVFLLRPPHLANIQKYFTPFFTEMRNQGISKIVFLSVQGVENQKKIPHHKLEKLILEMGFDYVFLRPSYFMQNLTSTLLYEIKSMSKIFIPAGNN